MVCLMQNLELLSEVALGKIVDYELQPGSSRGMDPWQFLTRVLFRHPGRGAVTGGDGRLHLLCITMNPRHQNQKSYGHDSTLHIDE